MARAMHQNSEPLPPSYMPEGLACAFIGSSDRGGKPTKEALDFINIIDPKRVSKVALYATSPSGDAASVLSAMKAAVQARGIEVLPDTFACHGKGTFGGKMPEDAELKAAAEFVDKITKMVVS
jgi:hypothetical protein